MIPGERFSNGIYIASFPGPAQLSVAFSTESWAGPGNEASNIYILGSGVVDAVGENVSVIGGGVVVGGGVVAPSQSQG